MSDTGNGATVSFTGGFTAKYIEVGGLVESIPTLPYSGLSTTGHEEVCPGDLKAVDVITMRMYFNSALALPNLGGTSQTVTITLPTPAGKTNGATIAGTGFFTRRTTPTLLNNQLWESELDWQFDGITGPTINLAT